MPTVHLDTLPVAPFSQQLLKWVGNKQRVAHLIANHFPADVGTYYEPFLGSGAVLATYAPSRAVASDVLLPLMEIWGALAAEPHSLIDWYATRREDLMTQDEVRHRYELVRQSFNHSPNGPDLLFLSRTCYGGVVRFRAADGYMSTPCGAHRPMSVDSFATRVHEWARRTQGTMFVCQDFRATMRMATEGDLIYCDPPYSDSQSILYGAQGFALADLLSEIEAAKARGVRVALSIDGTKHSGARAVHINAPEGLFESDIPVHLGGSMLRRFQLAGGTTANDHVSDRLLLTYPSTPATER